MLALIGLVLLAFAITAVTYLITDQLYGGTVPAVLAAALAGAFVVGWFLLPLVYRDEPTPEAHPPAE